MTTLAFNKSSWLRGSNNFPRFSLTKDSGLSEAASKVREKVWEVARDHLKPVSSGNQLNSLLEGIREAFQYAQSEDWEAEGNKRVAPETLHNARIFAYSIPVKSLLPEIDPDPDGQISFTWFVSPKRTLAVSIGPDGKISFASIVGISKFSGSTYEDYSELIDLCLKRLYPER